MVNDSLCILNLSCTYTFVLLGFILLALLVCFVVFRIHRRKKSKATVTSESCIRATQTEARQTGPFDEDFHPSISQPFGNYKAMLSETYSSQPDMVNPHGMEATNPQLLVQSESDAYGTQISRLQPVQNKSSNSDKSALDGLSTSHSHDTRHSSAVKPCSLSMADAEIAAVVYRLEKQARDVNPPKFVRPSSPSVTETWCTDTSTCTHQQCHLVAGLTLRVVCIDDMTGWWSGEWGHVRAWFRTARALDSELILQGGDVITVGGTNGHMWLACCRGESGWMPMPSSHSHQGEGDVLEAANGKAAIESVALLDQDKIKSL